MPLFHPLPPRNEKSEWRPAAQFWSSKTVARVRQSSVILLVGHHLAERAGQMSGERVERRLAAIMAGDIAGYSRLMGVDEEGTLRDLKELRASFLHPKIAEHRGRIVKTTGDGVLIEFPSVVDAVRCAVEIQRGMVERGALMPT